MEGNKEMIVQGGNMEVQENYTILKKNLTKAYVLRIQWLTTIYDKNAFTSLGELNGKLK
jgi:hypothetical protein